MLTSVQVELPPQPQSAHDARQFVTRALDKVTEDRRDVATLLVSELVTNAVLHAHTPIRVAAIATGERVRVEVADHSPRQPVAVHGAVDAPTGRGLGLVEMLADDWGIDPRDDGKVVWFELREGTAA